MAKDGDTLNAMIPMREFVRTKVASSGAIAPARVSTTNMQQAAGLGGNSQEVGHSRMPENRSNRKRSERENDRTTAHDGGLGQRHETIP
jgi:hypothetical protein